MFGLFKKEVKKEEVKTLPLSVGCYFIYTSIVDNFCGRILEDLGTQYKIEDYENGNGLRIRLLDKRWSRYMHSISFEDYVKEVELQVNYYENEYSPKEIKDLQYKIKEIKKYIKEQRKYLESLKNKDNEK